MQYRKGRPISKKNNRKRKLEQPNSSQDQYINNTQDPISSNQDDKSQFQKVIGFFMEFFQEIKHKNGFIFDTSARRKLIAEQNFIQWKNQTIWQQNRERQKAIQVIGNVNWSEKEKQFFLQICLHTSWIFDQEATIQLFTLLKKLWQICKQDNSEQQHRSLIDQIQRNQNKKYNFFSFQFSKNCHVNPMILKEGMNNLMTKLITFFKQMMRKIDQKISKTLSKS